MANGSSCSVAPGLLLASGVLPDLSLCLLHGPYSGQPFLCEPQSSGGDLIFLIVVKVFSVSLTWTHVVVVLMVLIVETGISLMELHCHSLEMVMVSMSIVELREFI